MEGGLAPGSFAWTRWFPNVAVEPQPRHGVVAVGAYGMAWRRLSWYFEEGCTRSHTLETGLRWSSTDALTIFGALD